MKKNKKKAIISTTLSVGLLASFLGITAYSSTKSITIGGDISINGNEFDYDAITDKAWAGKQVELEFYKAALTDIYRTGDGYVDNSLIEKTPSVKSSDYTPDSVQNNFDDGSTDIMDTDFYRAMAWTVLYQNTMMSDISFTNYVLSQSVTYPEILDSCMSLPHLDQLAWMEGVTILDLFDPAKAGTDDLYTWIDGTTTNTCLDTIIYKDDVALEAFRSLYLLAYLIQPYNIYSSVSGYDFYMTQILQYYQPVFTWQLSNTNFVVDDTEFAAWKTYTNTNMDPTTWNSEVEKSDLTVTQKEKQIPYRKDSSNAQAYEASQLKAFNGVTFLGGSTPGSVINATITENISGISASYDYDQDQGPTGTATVDQGADGTSTHFVNKGAPTLINAAGKAVNTAGSAGIKETTIGYLSRVKTFFPMKIGSTFYINNAAYDMGAGETNVFAANGIDNIIPVFYMTNSIRVNLPNVFTSAKQFWRTKGYYIELSGDAVDFQNYIDKDLLKVISNDHNGFLWFDGDGLFDGNHNGILDWWWWVDL